MEISAYSTNVNCIVPGFARNAKPGPFLTRSLKYTEDHERGGGGREEERENMNENEYK